MPIGISLLLDEPTAAKIIRPLPKLQGAKRPAHVNLATYSDEIDAASLIMTVQNITERWLPLSVSIVGYGVSPGDPSFVWAVPMPSGRLFEWHLALNKSLLLTTGLQSLEYGKWRPDVTLGRTTFSSEPTEVLSACWSGTANGRLDRLQVVRYDEDEWYKATDVLYFRRLRR